MAVNWGLLAAYPNAGQAFGQAFQQGIETNRDNSARNAMAVLAQDPNNAGALAALAKVDPKVAMQFQSQRAEMAKAQLAEHQDSILKGAEIIRQFNPKDQQTYTHALMAAQQAGIDVSHVPQAYDPAYVDGVVKLADALKPQSGDNPRFIPFQQGGGVIKVNPDGTTAMVIAPNDGSVAPGSPVAAAPPAAAIQRLRSNPGEAAQFDEIFGSGAAAKALGGQTAPAPSGGFP